MAGYAIINQHTIRDPKNLMEWHRCRCGAPRRARAAAAFTKRQDLRNVDWRDNSRSQSKTRWLLQTKGLTLKGWISNPLDSRAFLRFWSMSSEVVILKIMLINCQRRVQLFPPKFVRPTEHMWLRHVMSRRVMCCVFTSFHWFLYRNICTKYRQQSLRLTLQNTNLLTDSNQNKPFDCFITLKYFVPSIFQEPVCGSQFAPVVSLTSMQKGDCFWCTHLSFEKWKVSSLLPYLHNLWLSLIANTASFHQAFGAVPAKCPSCVR